MSSTVTSQWREKATGFFSSSSIKLKQASHTTGAFVGDVAKDAGSSFGEAAERAGATVRTRWSLLQQSRQKQQLSPLSHDSMQERIVSAAASTGTLLKRSISEIKEKVASGKIIVEEAAKKTAQRSKSILSNIERWQKDRKQALEEDLEQGSNFEIKLGSVCRIPIYSRSAFRVPICIV